MGRRMSIIGDQTTQLFVMSVLKKSRRKQVMMISMVVIDRTLLMVSKATIQC